MAQRSPRRTATRKTTPRDRLTSQEIAERERLIMQLIEAQTAIEQARAAQQRALGAQQFWKEQIVERYGLVDGDVIRDDGTFERQQC